MAAIKIEREHINEDELEQYHPKMLQTYIE